MAQAPGQGAADRAVQAGLQGLLGVDAVPVSLGDLQALDGEVEADTLEDPHQGPAQDRPPQLAADPAHHRLDQPLEDGARGDLRADLHRGDRRRRGPERRERRLDQQDDLDRRDDQQGDEHVLGVLDLQGAAVQRLAHRLARLFELDEHLGIGRDEPLPVRVERVRRVALDDAEHLGRRRLEVSGQLADLRGGVVPRLGGTPHRGLVALGPVGADDPREPLDLVGNLQAHRSPRLRDLGRRRHAGPRPPLRSHKVPQSVK
ncbi:hypothetical protein [Thermomonospora umbrina]|uniref:hypothetical protein n=1 Tax=Thermomonospora umbrina TaxID=111806 RepID=UPI0011C0FC36|nr:hypothetical protein [Thermomonospora umbrina]